MREFLARARGAAATARVLSLDELGERRGAEQATESWGLSALRGRLVELSARGASATLTTAVDLVLEAQTASEPVAWVLSMSSPTHGSFYPPDVAETGVDLSALVVVRAPDTTAAARATERLLRSGAFGLVVLDLGSLGNELTMAHQGRLVSLAQAHDAAIVCLTAKPEAASSLGSLVSLRAEAMRTRASPAREGFVVTLRGIKDKRRGPGWSRTRKARGPAGL